MKKNKKKVFVALSGGVDSSVSLYLLKEAGYDVTAVFIKIGESIETSERGEDGLYKDSCWINERRDAMRVAAYLDVPFLTFDFEFEYNKLVLDYFFKEYNAGRTPNPDVMCNRQIKFPLFWKRAKSFGADAMATGHYARIGYTNSINSKFEIRNPKQIQNIKFQNSKTKYKLLVAKDEEKDQSYFIYNLKKKDLEHILFPIGNLKKSEVRKIAKDVGLPTAEKKESQGLCFVGKVNTREFLKTRIKPKKGPVKTIDGLTVGEHDGVWYYTIGQRRGLGVYGGGDTYFVVDKDVKNNMLIVAKESQEKKFYKKRILLEDCSWVNSEPISHLNCKARARYRAPLEDCVLKKEESGFVLEFKKPIRAISPGQSAVLYKGEQVLGGGIIK